MAVAAITAAAVVTVGYLVEWALAGPLLLALLALLALLWRPLTLDSPNSDPLEWRPPTSRALRVVERMVSTGVLALNAPDVMRQGRKERVDVGVARFRDLRAVLVASIRSDGLAITEEEIRTSD
ncbi:MAG: hypothetical protein GEU94_21310, partial [Micromonosporaceae bacterium]|nr:hypothetical protein [Micromonosporaceae bacterium]